MSDIDKINKLFDVAMAEYNKIATEAFIDADRLLSEGVDNGTSWAILKRTCDRQGMIAESLGALMEGIKDGINEGQQ